MEQQNRPDLKISGAGSASGGFFNQVKLSGASSVNGDIDCNLLHVSGAGDIKGNVVSKEIKLSGACNIKGDVKCESFTVSGSSKISGSLNADDINISGSSSVLGDATGKGIKISGGSKIVGSLYGETVEFTGGIDVGKNCECENFKSKGSFKIAEMLNAGDIDISLYGECKVKEIGGEKITVKLCNNNISSVLNFLKSFIPSLQQLTVDTIEGDTIYLEGTTAKIVRGKNITIGEGCHIDKVEFTEDIKLLPNSIVKEQIKVQ